VKRSLRGLPNRELLARTHALVRRGREVEAELLAHLGEVDARRLYLEEACSSMFVYCVRVLHFSEAAAYKRIRAARAARRHPELLAALREGELHVTAVSLLASQLTGESSGALIRAARHRTADEIKRLLADRQPKPDVAGCARRVPAPGKPGDTAAPSVTGRALDPAARANAAAPMRSRRFQGRRGWLGWVGASSSWGVSFMVGPAAPQRSPEAPSDTGPTRWGAGSDR